MSAHRDDLVLEDQPSRNIAAGEPWWNPRHRLSGPSSGPDGVLIPSAWLEGR